MSSGGADADYAIDLTPAASRDLKAIRDRDLLERIDKKILSLSNNPRQHGSENLEGDTYRVRVGKYRIIYEVDDDSHSVSVTRVRHRREVYR